MFRTHEDVQRTPCATKTEQLREYSCDICDEGGWLSETEVEIHRKIKHVHDIWKLHSDKTKVICVACATVLPDKSTLYKHIKSIHLLSSETAPRVERQIFICDYCCQVFFNKAFLAVHIIRKHEKNNHTHVDCPKCLKRIKLKTAWSHMEYHQFQSVSLCPICLNKCANRNELAEHLKIHVKYYYCNICGFETKRENLFYEHTKSHRNMSAKPRMIDIKKAFMPNIDTSTLKYHMQNAIKGLTLFNNVHICVLCRQICTSYMAMQKHLFLDHAPQTEKKKKDHQCDCGEVFSSTILLKQHLFKVDGHRTKSNDVAESETVRSFDESEMTTVEVYAIPIEIKNENKP